MSEIVIGRQYEFTTTDQNGQAVSFFGKALGWWTECPWRPDDQCLHVEEWRDGYPLDSTDRRVAAINMKFYAAREIP